MKRFLLFLTCAVMLFGVSLAQETLVYTLTPEKGTNSDYSKTGDVTVGGITWTVSGNTQMQPWRVGGKSGNTSKAVRPIYSKNVIADNVSKVEMKLGSSDKMTFNSFKFIVSKNADFSSPVYESAVKPSLSATTTYTRPEGQDWSGCYYKFEFNITATNASSNGYIEFSEAKFYKSSDTGTVTPEPDPEDPEEPEGPTIGHGVSFEINNTNLGNNATAYVSTAFDFTFDGVTFNTNNINPSSGQVRGNKENTGEENFYIFNKTAIPNIEKIILTYSSEANTIGSDNIFLTTGTAVQSTKTSTGTKGNLSGTVLTFTFTDNNPYFRIQFTKSATSGTCKLSKVEIITKQADDPEKTTPEISWSTSKVSGTWSNLDAISWPTLQGAEGLDVTYTSSEAKVATVATDGTVTVLIPGTTTIKAETAATDKLNSASASYTLTVALDGTLTVAEALKLIKAGCTETAVVAGVITAVDEVSAQFGNATFDIKDADADASAETLKVFRTKNIGNVNFTADDKVEVGATVTAKGALQYYNNDTPELSNGELLSYEAPETEEPEQPEGPVEYVFDKNVPAEMTVGDTYTLVLGDKVPAEFTIISIEDEIATVSDDAPYVITAVAPGEAQFLASWEADDNFLANDGYEFTITIKAKQEGTDTPEPTEGSYTITFDNVSEDETSDISAADLLKYITEGDEYVASASGISKVYKGTTGLKFGSSKVVGKVVLNLSDKGKVNATKIVVNAKTYNSTNSNLSLNGTSVTLSSTELADYEYILDGTELTAITLETSGSDYRAYVKGLTIYYGEATPEQVATPTVTANGVAIEENAQIEAGTEITISTTTEGATLTGYIEFTSEREEITLDNEPAPYTFTVNDEDIVTITVLASAEGMEDSEDVELTFEVVKPEPAVPAEVVASVSPDAFVAANTEVTFSAEGATSFTITTYAIDGTSTSQTVSPEEAKVIVTRMSRRFEVVANNEVGSTKALEAFYNIGTVAEKASYVRVNQPSELKAGDRIVIGTLYSTTDKKSQYHGYMTNAFASNGFGFVSDDNLSMDDEFNYSLVVTELPKDVLYLTLEEGASKDTYKLKIENGGNKGDYLVLPTKNEINISSASVEPSNFEIRKAAPFSTSTEYIQIGVVQDNSFRHIQFNSTISNNAGGYRSYTSVQQPLIVLKEVYETTVDDDYVLAMHYTEQELPKADEGENLRSLALSGDSHPMTTDGGEVYTIDATNLMGKFSFSIDGEHELTGSIDQATNTTGEPYVYIRDEKFNQTGISLIVANDEKSAALTTHPDEANGQVEHHGNTTMTITLDPFRSIMLAATPNQTPTGVDNITVDGVDGSAEYYNLQGVRLDGRTLVPGTVVIRRQGTEVSKMVVR